MPNPRGRPRNFDPEIALDAATRVFWKNGYEGASMNDLVEATGMNKPSLYAAFGDKESLYLKALERYGSQVADSQKRTLDSHPDIWKALESLLRVSATALTHPGLPGGCLVVTGLADCGTSAMPAQPESALRAALASSESAIRDRLKRARAEGALPPSVDPAGLASLVASVLAGMGIQAKAGATRKALETSIDAIVALWPKSPRTPEIAHPLRKSRQAKIPLRK